MMKARNLGKLKAMRLGATKVMPIPGPENEEGKYLSEGAAREWSTVVIVIVIFIS